MRLRLATVLCCLAAIAGCSSNDSLDEDSAAHTAADPVAVDSLFVWAQSSYEDFAAASEQTGHMLADDHPIAKRLQGWADRVHELIRRDLANQGRTLLAPPPIVKVLESTEMNAWVSGVHVCLPKSIVDDAGVVTAPAQTGCVKPRNWERASESEYAAAVATALSALSGSECRIDAGAATWALHGAGCSAALASRGGVYATSPYVTYTTALVSAQLEERTAVQFLVHELGHYYRGHTADVHPFRAYWYEQRENAEAQPAPLADSDALELAAVRSGAWNQHNLDAAVPVPGQQLHAELTLSVSGVLADLLPAVKAETPQGFACQEALDLADGRWRSAFFAGARPRDDARESYLRFERSLLACSASLKIGDDFGPNTLPAGQYSAALTGYATSTLRQALTDADQAFRVRDLDLSRLTDALRARHAGEYTTEQEADDFSQENIGRLGFEPADVVDALFELMAREYGKDPAGWKLYNGDLDFDSCRALYRDGWYRTTPAGAREYVFVPIGLLSDPHHGDCYRMFNLSREQAIHHYRREDVPAPPATEWAPLRAAADEITRALPPPANDANHASPAPNGLHSNRRRLVDAL